MQFNSTDFAKREEIARKGAVEQMTGWEFWKWALENAYDHWIITILFLLCVVPWNNINFVVNGRKKDDDTHIH